MISFRSESPRRRPLIIQPIGRPAPPPELDLPWPSKEVPPIVVKVVIERTAPDIIVAGQYFDILL